MKVVTIIGKCWQTAKLKSDRFVGYRESAIHWRESLTRNQPTVKVDFVNQHCCGDTNVHPSPTPNLKEHTITTQVQNSTQPSASPTPPSETHHRPSRPEKRSSFFIISPPRSAHARSLRFRRAFVSRRSDRSRATCCSGTVSLRRAFAPNRAAGCQRGGEFLVTSSATMFSVSFGIKGGPLRDDIFRSATSAILKVR